MFAGRLTNQKTRVCNILGEERDRFLIGTRKGKGLKLITGQRRLSSFRGQKGGEDRAKKEKIMRNSGCEKKKRGKESMGQLRWTQIKREGEGEVTGS